MLLCLPTNSVAVPIYSQAEEGCLNFHASSLMPRAFIETTVSIWFQNHSKIQAIPEITAQTGVWMSSQIRFHLQLLNT